MRPSLSVLVPAFNEEASLETVVREIAGIIQRRDIDAEIVILDDGSTDRTSEVIASLSTALPGVIRPLRHVRNEGMAKTFLDLYAAAQKEFAIIIHADGQYPPAAIEAALPHLSSCDIVLCERAKDIRSIWRRLISSTYNTCVNLLFGSAAPDTRGIRCYRMEVIRSIPVRSKSVFADTERIILARRKGYKTLSITIPLYERTAGEAQGARVSIILAAIADMLRFRVRLWLGRV